MLPDIPSHQGSLGPGAVKPPSTSSSSSDTFIRDSDGTVWTPAGWSEVPWRSYAHLASTAAASGAGSGGGSGGASASGGASGGSGGASDASGGASGASSGAGGSGGAGSGGASASASGSGGGGSGGARQQHGIRRCRQRRSAVLVFSNELAAAQEVAREV